ncbi:MAG: MFS transporter [Oscillospiraceae bacterium]
MRKRPRSSRSGSLPLLYAGAMLVDAVAALVFGLLYDKKGVQALVWSHGAVGARLRCFVFACHGVGALLVGVALWGVGMGAQESILKAAVTQMVPKASRATGYGVFECAFGVFWFLGSWLLGVLYDVSIPAMVAVSVAAQLAAIPLYLRSAKLHRDGLKGENA